MVSGDTVASAVLWDIDGTLLSAKGSGARCFRDALTEVAGHPWPAGPHDFGGRTDVDIGSMILLAAAPDGPVDPEVLTRLLTTVERMYETREVEFAGTTVALPGVHDAVDALDAAGVLQTVVTGNMASIARRKLRAVRLADRLRLDLGAYGDDHADRAELMAAAVAHLATAVSPPAPLGRTWIIGDTPRDLAAARAVGARCALVATGTFPIDVLAELDADVVLPDLTAPDDLLALIVDP